MAGPPAEVVGDYAVGKTSLIRKYCTGEFTGAAPRASSG